jgi:hypothetical protein
MSQPARPTIIAENQTASPVVLTDLGATVPASGSFTLNDFYYLHEIQASKSLYDAIVADEILINDGVTTLTKAQSINFVTGVASAQDLQDGVTGPSSATANQIPKFDSTTGKSLVNSTLTIDGSNNLVMPGTVISGLASPTAADHAATKGYVDSVSGGVDWQESVLARQATPPITPTTGDRYLVTATATGAWTGEEDSIAQWDGAAWVFTQPDPGMATYVEAELTSYIYSNGVWVKMASTFDHGNLQGLLDDDHTQYLLVDGTRAMSGDLDMGANAITNVGLVDGVDVSAHASRHNPGGADALATAAAGTISVGDTSAEGTALSFARSDHVHALPAPAAPENVNKSAASAGTSTNVARADHKHDVDTAAPGATGVGTTSAEGTSTSLARADHVHQSNTPPVDVTKSAAAIGTSGEPARADHKHDIATAAPTVGIGAGNQEGTSTSLARADHNHAIRESGGQDLTLGAISDGEIIRRTGTTIAGGVGKRYPASATDPVSPSPAAGDTYFNTALGLEMFYDATRTKWLSVEVCEIPFGRSGNTALGGYYRGMDSLVLSDVTGRHAEFNGTVISLGYTRSDSDSASFEVTADGATVASLLSTAVSGRSNTLDGNFNQGEILAVRNSATGNVTSNVAGTVRVRWRV